MHTPVDITFRGMSPSPALEIAIRTWVARLEHDFDRILRCAVVVEQPHRSHRHGNDFHVHIDLSIAGHNIAVRDPGNEDPYVALGEAFRAARRQLRDVVDIRRERLRFA